MHSGFFITFEGGEGAGKSTQADLLARRLKKTGRPVITTREPGGTAGAEQVRKLLVTGDAGRWSASAECLLNYAAREDHLNNLIRPALFQGKTVICDRFMDSTRAYQGYAGGVDIALIDHLEQVIVGDTRPQLTLVFDIDPVTALARTEKRNHDENRFESKPASYHEKLRKAFLTIAGNDPERCVVIDASQPAGAISEKIWQIIQSHER